MGMFDELVIEFSYQSECHCAKTRQVIRARSKGFSYQSECHCAKTLFP